jgi:hypothetical protein
MQRFAQGGASSELVATTTGYGNVFVIRMNACFHGVFLTFNSGAASSTHQQGRELSMKYHSGAMSFLQEPCAGIIAFLTMDSKGQR